jgi:hypothetical protein
VSLLPPRQGGASLLQKPTSGGAWRAAATALTSGLRNMGLSHYATKELLVLENELEVRGCDGNLRQADW